jgi:hypothetical protein
MLLARTRLDAARSVDDFALAKAADTQEAMEGAWRVPISSRLSGVLPRPCDRAGLDLVASLLANDDRERLRAEFDEDWFRNPHALLYLRETDAAPFPLTVPKEALIGSADRLARSLEALSD